MKMLILPQLDNAALKRFWAKVNKRTRDECWKWTGQCNPEGRGQLSIAGSTYLATRLAYYIEHRADPGKLLVCHSCDNPNCVNPLHLWLGTQKDNVADCCEKNRKPCGAENGNATLTAKDVKEILQSGETNKALAIRYNVARPTISNIRRGKAWKHLPGKRHTGEVRIDSTTLVTGVSISYAGRFQARLTFQGKRYWIGRFGTVEEASQAIAEKRRSLKEVLS